jgi:hypothetical protein
MNDIKLKVISLFPTTALPSQGLRLDKSSGKWKFSIDYSTYARNSSFVPSNNTRLLFWTPATNQYFTGGFPPAIVTTPTPLIVNVAAPVGTVVGTLSVVNSIGSFTFSLTSNPGGLYQIVGNQLQVAAPLTVGTDPITIQADNGMGTILTLNTTVTVMPIVVAYKPTYHIYGF